MLIIELGQKGKRAKGKRQKALVVLLLIFTVAFAKSIVIFY